MKDSRGHYCRCHARQCLSAFFGVFAIVCCVLLWRLMLVDDTNSLDMPSVPSARPVSTSSSSSSTIFKYVKFVGDMTIAGRSMLDLNSMADKPASCGNDSLSQPPVSILYLPGTVESDVSPPLGGNWFSSLAASEQGGDGGPLSTFARAVNWSTGSQPSRGIARRRSPFCARHNAYLGYASNVDLDAVHLLLLSFDRFHTDCDTLVLFTDTTVAHLDRWSGDEGRVMLLKASDFLTPEAQELHATLARYFAFRAWMEQIGARMFDTIVHVDVRDVLFQQNFFAAFYHIAGSGHPEALRGVFTLAEESTFAERDLSSDWIRDVLPSRQAAVLISRLVSSRIDDAPLPIMNSGIVGGGSLAYRDYLVAMTTLVAQLSPTAKGRYGIDQGVHIVLFSVGFHACRFPHPALLLSSRTGPARNSFLPPAAVHRDVFGRVVNCNRQPYALLHQMDRFPSLYTDLKRPYRAMLRQLALVQEKGQELLPQSIQQATDFRRDKKAAKKGLTGNEEDNAKSSGLYEYLSSARSGAFRYVRCRVGNRDVRQLVLIVLCSRGLQVETAEPFLRRLLEQASTCTDVVLVVAGGSALALASLELDFDGRFEAVSTLFASSVTPAAIAHAWLKQRPLQDGHGLEGDALTSVALDVDFSALPTAAVSATTQMRRKGEVHLPRGGGISVQGNISGVMNALARLVRSDTLLTLPTKEGIVKKMPTATTCTAQSRWWRGTCWEKAAYVMASKGDVQWRLNPRGRLPSWNTSQALYVRHPNRGGPTTGGIFVTRVEEWNK